MSTARQGEDRQAKLFSEPHCTSQNCNLHHANCKFYAENWREEEERMNINIKRIKINCSGQREQKPWVFKRPPGLIPKHIFSSSFECLTKKWLQNHSKARLRVSVCSEAHGPDAAKGQYKEITECSLQQPASFSCLFDCKS